MATRDEEQSSQRLAFNLKEAKRLLQEIRVEAARNANTFGEINTLLKDKKTLTEDTREALNNSGKSLNNLKKLSNELAGFDEERLKNRKETEKFLENEAKVQEEIQRLQSQILVIEQEKETQNKTNKKLINAQLEDLYASLETAKHLKSQFNQIADANDRLNSKTAFFDSIADATEKVPILSSFFKDAGKASEKIRESFGQNGVAAGFDAIAKMSFKLIFGAAATQAAVTNQQVTSLARNLNVSRKNATEFRDGLVDAMKASGKPVSYLMESFTAINSDLGTTGVTSLDTAKTFSTMTHRLGIAQEEASKLFNISAAVGKEFKKLNTDLIKDVKLLNMASGAAIDYKEIMKDISGFSSATVLTQNKFAGGLVKAAYTARRLGLEMSTLEGISGNLLDFESSIASELEAELLTGRQLNLETARLAALKGDLTKVGLELEKQGITAEKFGSMNVLQQEAIAKAMGMSREEMASMFTRQKAIARLAEETKIAGFAELDTKEQIKQLAEAKGISTVEAAQMLGEEELARQEATLSLAEVTKDAAKILAESQKGDVLDKAVTQPLKKFLGPLASMAGLVKGMAIAGIAYYAASGLSKLASMGMFKGLKMPKLSGVKNMFSLGSKAAPAATKMVAPMVAGTIAPTAAKSIAPTAAKVLPKAVSTVAPTAAKAVTKTAGKSIGKSLLKKIPVVGALAGIGFGISRAMKGDFTGAIGEVASGAASLIPGIGTAASVAIDAGLAARDIYKGTSRSDETITQAASDASTKSEKAAKTQEELLKENKKLTLMMERMLQKETNILMDGAKVGQQVFKNTYKA